MANLVTIHSEDALAEGEAPPSADEILAKLAEAKATQPVPTVEPEVTRALQPTRGPLPPLTPARQWQLVFGPEVAQPYSDSTVVVQPGCLFRGERIVISGDPELILIGLYVGQRNQMPYGFPISAFAPNALGSGTRMDTCEPGLAITMQVRNITAKAVTWSAVIFGRAVL